MTNLTTSEGRGGGVCISLIGKKPLFLYSLFLFYLLQCTLLDFPPFSSLSSLPFLSCCHRKTTYGSGNVMHDNREMFSLWNETIYCNFLSFEYWNMEFFPIKDMQTPPPPPEVVKILWKMQYVLYKMGKIILKILQFLFIELWVRIHRRLGSFSVQ